MTMKGEGLDASAAFIWEHMTTTGNAVFAATGDASKAREAALAILTEALEALRDTSVETAVLLARSHKTCTNPRCEICIEQPALVES